MGKTFLKLVIFSLAFVVLPAFAQGNPEGPGCGDPSASFSVETDHVSGSPVAGKALVYVIEDDSNFAAILKPTTRAGLDSKWIGATHGNSYLYFPVDPGVHHLCASWQKAVGLLRRTESSLLHFTAEAGGVYFFEVKNVCQDVTLLDTTFEPIDSDEGQVLVARYQLSSSHLKH